MERNRQQKKDADEKAGGIPVDKPWRELSVEERAWVIDGEGSWRQKKWYGVQRFFAWLESKSR